MGFVVAGCSASGGGGGTTADLGVATADLAAPTNDLSVAAKPDLLVVHYGTPILTDAAYKVHGETEDGYLIVDDGSAYYAVSAADKSKTKILDFDSGNGFQATVVHKVAFIGTGLDQNGIGVLTAWSKAGGTQALNMNGFASGVDESTDGSYIAYIGNVDASGVPADLIVDKPDHSAPKTVASGLDLTTCFPTFYFAGKTFVASHCPASADAGATVGEITAFDPATGKGTALLAAADPNFARDKAETRVLGKVAATNLKLS
jgi:hypothetical protein